MDLLKRKNSFINIRMFFYPMIYDELISKLVSLGQDKVNILFKPKQFEVLKKIESGENLTETQQRYLRGTILKKLKLLYELNLDFYNPKIQNYVDLLKILDDYYITGLEAIKHNGYGWDYTTKIVEIINPKLDGEIDFSALKLKFIKVKSMKNYEYITDGETGVKFATNEQIIKDSGITKNSLVKKRWINVYSTYGESFSKYKPNGVK